MITVDIESEAIVKGAPLLPFPVGIAVDNTYHSWGHPSENSLNFDQAKQQIAALWDKPLCTHNGAGFDIPVLQHWFKLPPRPPELTHDTLFLAYLDNPNSRTLSLKELAHDLLGMEPEEQDELNQWIVANVPECRTAKQAGAYISRAPADIVGRYAVGDTTRTLGIWQQLEHVVGQQGAAYSREQKLAPILAEMQNIGVRVDMERLRADEERVARRLEMLDDELRKQLGAPALNLDSNAELAAALKKAGYSDFKKTPKGQDSVSKESLQQALAGNPQLSRLLHYRGTLRTIHSTFMVAWLKLAGENKGRLHASYNQVRNPDGYGTRTGRLSSSNPNLQNVSNRIII